MVVSKRTVLCVEKKVKGHHITSPKRIGCLLECFRHVGRYQFWLSILFGICAEADEATEEDV